VILSEKDWGTVAAVYGYLKNLRSFNSGRDKNIVHLIKINYKINKHTYLDGR
jgi:hypothetical protein